MAHEHRPHVSLRIIEVTRVSGAGANVVFKRSASLNALTISEAKAANYICHINPEYAPKPRRVVDGALLVTYQDI